MAVVLDVRLRAQQVGDLLLRAGSDVLVLLQLGDARLPRIRDVIVGGVRVVIRHLDSFVRSCSQRR